MGSGRLLTRKQLLTYAALGLLGCSCGASRRHAHGDGLGVAHDGAHGASPGSTGAPRTAGGFGLDRPATAGSPATRLEPPRTNPRPYSPGELIVSVHTDEPIIAFTFDDGPWPRHTRAIMDIFDGRGLAGLATFFWIGNNVLAFPDIAREVVDRGYPVANHSLTHSTYVPWRVAAEIAPAQDAIASVVGIRQGFFRSPGLTRGAVIQQRLAEGMMCNIFTDSDLRDWVTPRVPATQLVGNFARRVRPGSIVLLHDGGSHQQTVDAVGPMLDIARQRGLEVVPLDTLLRVGRRSSTFEGIAEPPGAVGATSRWAQRPAGGTGVARHAGAARS